MPARFLPSGDDAARSCHYSTLLAGGPAGPAAMKAAPRDESHLGELLRALLAFLGPKLVPTLALVAFAALLEGLGIVLLLPVAETIFAQQAGASTTGVTALVLHWLEEAGLDTALGQLAALGIAFVALVAVRALVLLRRDIVLAELSYGFVDAERRRLFSLLAHADWPVIKRLRKAHLLNSMTTNISRLSHMMTLLSRILVTAALALAGLGAAFVVSWKLGLLLSGMAGVALLFGLYWSRRSRQSGEELNTAQHGVMEQTTLFLDGLKAAKATQAEDALTAAYSDRIAEVRQVTVDFIVQQGRLRNWVQMAAALVALLVLLAGYGLIGLGGGELLVMAAIVVRLGPALNLTVSSIQSLAHALPAYSAIKLLEAELLAASAALAREHTPSGAPGAVPEASQPLELLGCTVRVAEGKGGAVTLLEADEITIPPGSLVHVGGASGAGKSTLAELMAGLQLPAEGEVRRGSVLLTAQSRRAWQGRVSFAPQEPFLFDDTVRANLCWPNLSSGEGALWKALETVEAAELVRSLPRGLDEPLLDGGARLSGGERQRLCLARALLRDADLLILDEATSAMDPHLERTIVERLRPSGSDKIVLMVSHSRNALDLADLQVEVSEGFARKLG